ncbi:MAG: D-ribose pyranase [Thermoanaerobacteraceae bacterium]|nr:D-ribose pyranase [Thermoanaerobacteraceae bacterium]
MKKGVLLNHELSELVARLGDGETIVIANYHLTVPDSIRFIDLAVKKNMPGLVDVVEAVLTELYVSEVIVPVEMERDSQDVFLSLKEVLGNIDIERITCDEFRLRSMETAAIVRTGEFTPHASIILRSGVKL